MDTIRTPETVAQARVGARRQVVAVVDCADGVRQDVLACWLTRAGCKIREGFAADTLAARGRQPAADILLTDRFGPRFHGQPTILQLKTMQPSLRVVIVGDGDSTQSAQLSLANAAGADAVLPEPLDRHQVLEMVERWS